MGAFFAWWTTDRAGLLLTAALAVAGYLRNRSEARGAAAAARKARRLARKSARASERMADALEGIQSTSERRVASLVQQLPSLDVTWVVERVAMHTYEVTNEGTATAFDVEVVVLDALEVSPPFQRLPAMAPGDSTRVTVSRLPDGPLPQLVVTWSTGQDVPPTSAQWKRVLT